MNLFPYDTCPTGQLDLLLLYKLNAVTNNSYTIEHQESLPTNDIYILVY